jgi:DNA-binding SARP family transcriptional activator
VLQPSRGDGATSDYIQHDRGRYRFNIEAPYWLDLDAFQELAAQADPVALKTAVELYRGYYLEDTVWALPPDVEAQQRKFEQLYINALRRLIAQTEGRETLVYLEKLLMIEPTDETAYQALVLGYLAQGRADLARRQVAKWQQALLEFELEPSSETLTLWDRVETRNGHTP